VIDLDETLVHTERQVGLSAAITAPTPRPPGIPRGARAVPNRAGCLTRARGVVAALGLHGGQVRFQDLGQVRRLDLYDVRRQAPWLRQLPPESRRELRAHHLHRLCRAGERLLAVCLVLALSDWTCLLFVSIALLSWIRSIQKASSRPASTAPTVHSTRMSSMSRYHPPSDLSKPYERE